MRQTSVNQLGEPVSDSGIQRLYYSISEVSELTGVGETALRYWETEFKQITPRKNRNNKRQYRESDVQVIQYIKDLLWVQKYTIEGARLRLAQEAAAKEEENRTVEQTFLFGAKHQDSQQDQPDQSPIDDSKAVQTLRETRQIAEDLKRLLEM